MSLKHTTKTLVFLNEHHDNCTLCGRAFEKDDTTHLGYINDKTLVNIGNCCSGNLTETIIRHVFRKRVYEIPPNDTVLWRFMDFTKFVSLLSTSSLYFTRADLFSDPFEGAKGVLKNKKKWDKLYLEFFKSAIENPPEPEPEKEKKSKDYVTIEAKRLLSQLDSIGSRQQTETFINCWHENPYESEAMWKLYTSNLAQGISIKTTYYKLYRALNRNPSISIGRVNYIDYNKEFAGINDSFWYKRKSFEHEKEVRAIVKGFSSNGDYGKLIKVDLNILIDKIYISPTSPTWIIELVKDVLVKYGLNKKIEHSELNEKPFH
ncbi:MAG: hypothetical protein Q8T04_14540 [Bacteroidota bacterium]|nr:hypothetical protein [Bacteroidota bacterium]